MSKAGALNALPFTGDYFSRPSRLEGDSCSFRGADRGQPRKASGRIYLLYRGVSKLNSGEASKALSFSPGGLEEHIRSGPHLSPLTLETSNSLLPPLGSHLEY